MPLRDAIATYASRFRNVAPFARDEVVVSPGLKPLIWNVLSALLDPGDEILFADPAYPAYAGVSAYLQAKAVPIPLLEATDFRLDLDMLAAKMSYRTKVLVLNSPHNPTGGVLTRADLETIAELALRHDVTVVSDEIYSRNIYDGSFFSILALDGMRERTILLDGFSKAYAMTGWRLGYGIMPRDIAKIVALLGQNNYSCTTTFVQDAGIAALEGPDDDVLRDGCRVSRPARRDRRGPQLTTRHHVQGAGRRVLRLPERRRRNDATTDASRRSFSKRRTSRHSAARVSARRDAATCASRMRIRWMRSRPRSSACAPHCRTSRHNETAGRFAGPNVRDASRA